MTTLEEIISRFDSLGLTEERDGTKYITHYNTVENDEPEDDIDELMQLAIAQGMPEEKAKDQAAFKDRILRFVASTDDVDRYGDRIAVDGKIGKKAFGDGWKLENFEKNPVFMPFHSYAQIPLGTAVKTWKDVRPGRKKALRMTVLMDDGDANPVAPLMTKAYKNGVMRGNSVGFMPVKWHAPEKEERESLGLGRHGVVFGTQDLWENSAVSIPANPKALNENAVDCKGMQCYLRFAEEVRDVDPEFGYRIRHMIRTGLGQVYLNRAEKEIESGKDRHFVKMTIPEPTEGFDLEELIETQAAGMKAAIDRINEIANGLDAVLGKFAEMAEQGKGTEPDPTNGSHVVDELLSKTKSFRELLQKED